MSANFWASSQRQHWQFTKQSLRRCRQEVAAIESKLREQIPAAAKSPISVFGSQYRLYIHSLIQHLGRQLSVRERVLGTAEVYATRFFTKVSMLEVNVYLVVAACMYVACKTEECPQHIRTVTTEARSLWIEFVTHDPTKIAECEFFLIEELEGHLIVHHPHRALLDLVRAVAQFDRLLTLEPEEVRNAWWIVNDSYSTDVLLLHPPHLVAAACLYITVVLKSPMTRSSRSSETIKARIDAIVQFLGHSGVDLNAIAECIQEIISLYVRWDTFDETKCRAELFAYLTKD